MNAIKDGGPAFPSDGLAHAHGVYSTHHSGMTLRDYFAAKAMQGDWACGNACSDDNYARDARRYYKMADAMLAAREAQP